MRSITVPGMRPLLAGLVAGLCLLGPSLARADDSSQLTVTGPSELESSGLFASVLVPELKQVDPSVTLRFLPASTPQAAVADARSGLASVLLADAPADEAGFVAGGFSWERAGSAVFYTPRAATGQGPAVAYRAYVVNPDAFPSSERGQFNLSAALDFLDMLTNAAFQARLKPFVGAGGVTFLPDASPVLTATGLPSGTVAAGATVTVSGKLSDPVPDSPALAGQLVQVQWAQSVGADCIGIAGGQTDANGDYSITFTPQRTGVYLVVTDQLTQLEDPAAGLSQLLQPVLGGFSEVTVPGSPLNSPPGIPAGALTGVRATGLAGRLLVTGSLTPAAGDGGSVALLVAHRRAGPYRRIATGRLRPGDRMFALSADRKPGRVFAKIRYRDAGVILPANSDPIAATVHPARGTIRITSIGNHDRRLLVEGRLRPRVHARSTTVQLLGVNATSPPAGAPADTAMARMRLLGTTHPRSGDARFTIHARLTAAGHWLLIPRYLLGHGKVVYGPLAHTG